MTRNPLLQALIDAPPRERLAGDSPLSLRSQQIQKLKYTHEAMIDILIAQPWIKQDELAAHFGMSPSWISTVICSDIFQSKLAERRDKLVDPEIRSSLKTQFAGLLARSMEILRHKLDQTPDRVPDQLAVQVAKMAGQSLGYGAVEGARISVHETHVHLEELGNNLVGLLRRRKAEVIDGQANTGGDSCAEPPSAAGNGAPK